MGNPIFGRQVIGNVGSPISVLVNGEGDAKTGGVTVDWATIAAASVAVILPDGIPVSVGEKVLPMGQVLTQAATAEIQTITIANNTGGTYLLTYPATTGFFPQTTAAIAHDATAAALQDILNALPRFGAGGVGVTKAGSVWTVTYNRSSGDVPLPTADITSLVGAGASVTPLQTTAGTGTGKYGPYDNTATDGRQVITEPGRAWLNVRTVKENDLKSECPAVVCGGQVYRKRVKATDGVHSLAAGPTWAELMAVMPRLIPVWD
jgi:hypothetical protein